MLCNISSLIRRKEALSCEVSEITSPILSCIKIYHEVAGSVPGKLQKHSVSELTEIEISPDSVWAIDCQFTFLVSDLTTSVRGMDLTRKEWTLLNRYRGGLGRCNYGKRK